MLPYLDFAGNVAIVTGAGSDLGRAYAVELAQRGAKIVVNDSGLNKEGTGFQALKRVDQVVEQIISQGGIAFANYSSLEEADSIIDETVKQWGKVDILINHCDFDSDSPLLKMDPQKWDSVIDQNLKRTFLMCSAAWNYMARQSYGRILNTSSLDAVQGREGSSNRTAAHLAIHGLTQTLAKEGKVRGITVNTLALRADTGLETSEFGSYSNKMKKEQERDIFKQKKKLKMFYSEVSLVTFLCHNLCTTTGTLFTNNYNTISILRLERSKGVKLSLPISAEEIRNNFREGTSFRKDSKISIDGNDPVMRIFKHYSKNVEWGVGGEHIPKDELGLRSTAIFEMVSEYLRRGEGLSLVQACRAIFNFRILEVKKGNVLKEWGFDLKHGNGSISQNPFKNADAIFKITDSDFVKLSNYETPPQLLFTKGRLKIKGDMTKAALFLTIPDFPRPSPANLSTYKPVKL